MTTTPNMLLVLPSVSATAGPQWATMLNTEAALIDAHDHSTGKGVQITPSGINISGDLTFNSNNAIALRTTRYTNFSSFTPVTADKGVFYVLNNELYFIDGVGNTIQVTSGGALDVSASITTLTIKDSSFYLQYFGDITRQFRFDASAIPTSTTRILSVPDSGGNDTFVTQAATQALTNKTIGAGNVLSGATAATLVSGAGTLTLPAVTDTLVTLAATQTLTNKILTGNTAASLSPDGVTTFTFPAVTDTAVALAASQILTNKSLGNTTVVRSASAVQFNNSANTFSTSLQAGSNTANATFKLPIADGTSGQAIVTDASGNLSFATISGAGTSWTAYTPTFSAGFGTVSSISVFWKTVGDSLFIRGTATAGTTTGAAGSISLPSGKSIDSSKVSSSATLAGQIVAQDGSVNGLIGTLLIQVGSSTTTVRVGSPYGGANLLANNGTSSTITAGDMFSFQCEVPWV